MSIENLAQKVQDKLVTKQDVVIDPATVMLIMTIVSGVIRAWKECKKKPEEAVVVAQYPTDKEKRGLKRLIRKELGLRKYWKEGSKYYDAVLEAGSEITTKDLRDVFRDTESTGERNRQNGINTVEL